MAEGRYATVRQYEGFYATPYWDVNHWRIGYGSDTITTPDGRVIEVTQNTPAISREDAQRDLDRRMDTEFMPSARAEIGEAAWRLYTPQQQEEFGAAAYNYGNLPNDIAAAARTGNVQAVAQAFINRGEDNGGIRRSRYAQAASSFSGSGATAYTGTQTTPGQGAINSNMGGGAGHQSQPRSFPFRPVADAVAARQAGGTPRLDEATQFVRDRRAGQRPLLEALRDFRRAQGHDTSFLDGIISRAASRAGSAIPSPAGSGSGGSGVQGQPAAPPRPPLAIPGVNAPATPRSVPKPTTPQAGTLPTPGVNDAKKTGASARQLPQTPASPATNAKANWPAPKASPFSEIAEAPKGDSAPKSPPPSRPRSPEPSPVTSAPSPMEAATPKPVREANKSAPAAANPTAAPTGKVVSSAPVAQARKAPSPFETFVPSPDPVKPKPVAMAGAGAAAQSKVVKK